MVSRGRPYLTTEPVIIEVKPGNLAPKSNMAPSSPSPSGSPKAVRFAPEGLVKSKARALTPTEAWSFYHFETHCRQCHTCFNPAEARARGGRLCPAGHGLAQDVREHVYLKDGQVYSSQKENHKRVLLELEPGYDQLRQLFRILDRSTQPSTHRTVPIVTYDTRLPESEPVYERNEVIIEPSHTSTRRSQHKSTRYRPVVVSDDTEIKPVSPVRTPPSPTLTERRGSLYVKDMQRPRDKAYHVEIREPADVREHGRRQEHHRRSTGYWE
ncbi:Hypothetical protein R9X50_00115200 [Acrodontium crateriforme]|uniref:Uncharacterized protein n=1 Tax=Acrodontium crateriforme TaxID=150365 RepID=A0AAQ3R5K0_9PEZI|nr:Hypothetical protein R9X50_00115200 [Acrodontium crateriforme]